MAERVRCDGKFFSLATQRFHFRGVTYGTFAPRADSERYPERAQVDADFAQIAAAGFTVVRTYTAPPPDVVEAAGNHDLRLLAGVFYADWRYSAGRSRRELREIEATARDEVRAAARRFAGDERVLALSLGNEIPADVLRWVGTGAVARTIRDLASIVREEDPTQLVTYANYPTAEYLPLDSLDFLTFNVFLEDADDLRRYLTRLQHQAGDRPLVLGEMGISCGPTPDGDARQAAALDAQFDAAVDRGVAGTCVFSFTDDWWVGDAPIEGWQFGLTHANRSTRPAWDVAARWNRRAVRDLDRQWPSISVVVCAYNASSTIAECLRHTCALDYPNLDVVVVDDGSTDDTAEIAARFPRARLVGVRHAGLSVARNEGFRAARGEIVAYLDSDAYPSPEWPYFLALGFDTPNIGGVGGPNVPPVEDPPGAHVVARAPGGPVHVLLTDDRAEHIPGCNMAFWKGVLTEVGGCDPIYTAAGDDVDLCWRIRDRQWEIGFHPAALVWHHRRPTVRAYLRQQRGYGRAEALVESRHPDRFTAVGTARWRGRIYNSSAPSVGRQRVYRGPFGTAAYQSVYQRESNMSDLLHQVGVPVSALALPTAPLALIAPLLGLPALAALLLIAGLAVSDIARAHPPRRSSSLQRGFRIRVAALHLLQPIVRVWGHHRHRPAARRELPPAAQLPVRVGRFRGGTVIVLEDRPRDELAATTIDELRRRGVRANTSTGWDDYDARLTLSHTVFGDLQTSSHPTGWVQARIRSRLRYRRLAIAAALALVLGAASPPLAALAAVPASASTLRGLWRSRRLLVTTFPPRPARRSDDQTGHRRDDRQGPTAPPTPVVVRSQRPLWHRPPSKVARAREATYRARSELR